MIQHLTGTIASAGATWLVVDLGGFGLKVHCPPATAAGVRPGAVATVHTSLVVREDSLTLFGFATEAERDCFELVQTATGVGPKLALAIVSVLSPDGVRVAVQTENLATLVRVPGVGRKGAQRLVIELKDKVAHLGTGAADESSGAPIAELWREQVMDGVQGLGWSARDAELACDNVAELAAAEPQPTIGVLMRAALASLARK